MNDSSPIEEEQVLVGRYKIRRRLGSGAMGAVYQALDLVLKRDVALKLLRSGSRTQEQLVRLQREARAICQLKHANIIDVYDFVLGDGNVPILAMEYVDGESLGELLERDGPLEPTTAVFVFEQICSALSYAHGRHIMHRDLKPGNILVQSEKQFKIKIIDFGIAKLLDEDGSLTSSGMIVGTPSYISPEQARHDNVDYRSDIYSLGCLMYKTLTGRAVFRGTTVVETLQAQMYEEPPSLKEGNRNLIFSDKLEQIVAKALKKDPDERFQTMEELNQALKTLRSSAPEQEVAEPDVPAIAPRRVKNLALPLILLMVLLSVIGIVVVCTRSFLEAPVQIDAKTRKEQGEILESDNQVQTRRVGGLTWHYLRAGAVSDEQLKALSKLDVKRLVLSKTSITDEQLNLVADLPLILLDLRDTNISNKGIEVICKKMKGLQALLIERCPNVDHSGYRALGQLKNLKVLSLRDTNVSDEDLAEISKLTDLYLLYVANSPNITDRAIEPILKLQKLGSIRVDGTRVTTAGIERLKALPKNVFIGMSNLHLRDDTMPKSYSDCITMLDVSNNPISRAGLKSALRLPHLWYLDVRNCPGINSDLKTVRFLSWKFPREHGKVVMTNDTLGLETPEGYLNPEFYSKDLTRLSVQDRLKVINETFEAFARSIQ